MKRVLIVEDDVMIADLLEEIIADNGDFEVCGMACGISTALSLAAAHNPELAIVDVYLTDGLGTDLAPILMSRHNTGILYATANTESMHTAQGHACLLKPFRIFHVPMALSVVAEIVTTAKVPILPAELKPILTILDGRRAWKH